MKPNRRAGALVIAAAFCMSALGVQVRSDATRVAPIELRDGDRVAFIGATLIEREPHYGFWEAALAARLAGRNITFRNLGWSGDTVFGTARASFDPVEKGFERLIAVAELVKPTVIVLAYGVSESFEGPEGVEAFVKQYSLLLDRLRPIGARLALMTPPLLESPPDGLLSAPPDPTEANANIEIYAGAVRKLAAERGLPVIDLLEWRKANAQGERLTDNTMNLTAAGYRRTADFIAASLGAGAAPWSVTIQAGEKTAIVEGTTINNLESLPDGSLRFELADAVLPLPPLPSDSPGPEVAPAGERIMRISGLTIGTWALKVDGAEVARATADAWAGGVEITRGPEIDQAGALRGAIVRKNELFFHRWRPQNETYLFGFRKHEQGRNAKEIPEFEPLVMEADMGVAALKTPRPRKYELLRIGERVK